MNCDSKKLKTQRLMMMEEKQIAVNVQKGVKIYQGKRMNIDK